MDYIMIHRLVAPPVLNRAYIGQYSREEEMWNYVWKMKAEARALGVSLLAVAAIIAILDGGYSGCCMLICTYCSFSALISTTLIGMSQGISFTRFADGMAAGVTKGLPAMFIFILIGVLIGAWISAGTVPAL